MQIAVESFQAFPEFSFQWSSQTTFGIFEILKIEISLTWDSIGMKISKHYSYKLQLKVLKLVLNFSPNGPHKTPFGILKF